MEHVHVHVLFGHRVPSDVLDGVRANLEEFGIEAEVQMESLEGIPADPLIVTLTAPLSAFFGAIMAKAGEDTWLRIKKIFHLLPSRVRGIQTREALRVNDTESGVSVLLAANLPETARRDLFPLVQSCRGITGYELRWSDRWQRWRAHPTWGFSLEIRRVPIRPSRVATRTRMPSAADTDEATRHAPLMDTRTSKSVIALQRAAMVRDWLRNNKVSAIARRNVVSRELVRATILDFSQAGRKALLPDFDGGVAAVVDDDIAVEIRQVARSVPESKYEWEKRRSRFDSWTIQRLSNFLVVEGVIEDIGYRTLSRLLDESAIDMPLR